MFRALHHRMPGWLQPAWGWLRLAALLALLSGAFSASATTYQVSSVPLSWDTTTRSILAGADNSASRVSFGFTMRFGTASYTRGYISSNGKIHFTTRDSSQSNVPLPTGSSPQLLVYWDDLRVYNSNATVTYGTFGTAPNRRFVVTWVVGHCCTDNGARVNFQAALFESGDIEYRYAAMPTDAATFAGETVGLQVNSTDFNQVAYNSLMPSNVAYRFSKGSSVHHIEITSPSSGGVTCSPSVFTIKTCADAACSLKYTGGLSGTLSITGNNLTVNYPAGPGFAVASGSSATTVQAQVTTPGTATVGVTGLTPSPTGSPPLYCGFAQVAAAGNSCNFSIGEGAVSFAVNNHYAGAPQTLSVKAQGGSGTNSCAGMFTSQSRNFTASCAYVNPSTGTRAVTLAGTALNATNNEAAACAGAGRSIALAFDATGTATTQLVYKDVGDMLLTLAYVGSAATGDAGLSIRYAERFVAAPLGFKIDALPGSAVNAGAAFGFHVTAQSIFGGVPFTTPNFGLEASPEAVTVDFVRTAPLGSGGVDGLTDGSTGNFSNGVAPVSDASWTEVGMLSPSASLASGDYLGSGLAAAGGTGALAGWTYCAAEGGTCTVPSGVTAALYYGNGAAAVISLNVAAGNYACSSATFGDPSAGNAKACYSVPLSGAGAVPGAITVRPHHFDVATTNACGSFTHAGQPFSTLVTARNALGDTTMNYDGTSATSPNFARAVSLSEGSGAVSGSLAGTAIGASAFAAGAARTLLPSYGFNAKQSPPQSIVVRASDTDGVSSSGFTEGSIALRSSRLRLSNAFGRGTQALAVPVRSEYWTGASWLLNSADNCSAVPVGAVVASNARNHAGNTASVTTAASAAVSLAAGSGLIAMSVPTPATTGVTFDLALNLGSAAVDQACVTIHPASSGAARPWLRSNNGSCVATADRDPAARISFGIYTPESAKTVHTREVF